MSGTRSIPFIHQQEWADCAAACLAMVLALHGRFEPVENVRRAVGATRDGIDALSFVESAAAFGLRGRGLSVTADDVRLLPRGAILHWTGTHFVVLDRVERRGVRILDPAQGRRVIAFSEFRRRFSGVAIVLEPTSGFVTKRSPGSHSRILQYFAEMLQSRSVAFHIVLVSVMLRVVALAAPVLTALVVDDVVPHSDDSLLLTLVLGIAVLLGFRLLSRVLRSLLLLEMSTRLDMRSTVAFLAHLLALPVEFFRRRSNGDLLMRVSSNVNIREIMTSTVLSTVIDGVFALVYLVAIAWLDVAVLAFIVCVSAIQVALMLFANRRVTELMDDNLEAQARSQSRLVEVIAGVESLKLAGAESRAVQDWAGMFARELNAVVRRGRFSTWIDGFRDLLLELAPMAILAYGALLVTRDDMSLGTMLALCALASAFLTPLGALVGSGIQIARVGSYFARLDTVLGHEPERTGGDATALHGRIELRRAGFRYGPTSPWVFRDLDLTIEAGSCVAIVGASGSGKSTLAALLLGLYPPTEGQLLFDGREIAELDLSALRRQIGCVPQQPHIFGGTVHDNIALAVPLASPARVHAASRRACIDDEIRSWPLGYQTPLAEGGRNISGGQRQRIALARALLSSPRILVLDEATSSLDADSEARVIRQLLVTAATRVIVAHRLSSVVHADQIIVMAEGRIVERGRHEELVGRGGHYSALVRAQLPGERGRC